MFPADFSKTPLPVPRDAFEKEVQYVKVSDQELDISERIIIGNVNESYWEFEYLHFFCDPPMFHVSVSSSTILLDENFNAKLCDIGILCSHGSHITLPESLGSTECSGPVCGNIIFQLGLLILELVTGQCSEEGGGDIIQWVQESHYSRSIHKMLDPDLGNNFDSRELKALLAVARLCIKSVDKPPLFTPQVFSISASDGHDVPVVVAKAASGCISASDGHDVPVVVAKAASGRLDGKVD
ncbi:hypothetical protein Acr_28g0009820 [Actinidia rufa]|uniref:Protein kinase superfamily protein n=1 Tax=Actinidia rufa TaxID=165716 RepID=A0A7J0HAZ4_9ERIC|nr:hypothetical protein Acr_28g0009820 [Actinidia rufa]